MLRIPLRIAINIIVITLAVMAADVLLPGFDGGSPIRFGVWVAVLDGIAVPLVVLLAFPFVVYTAGLLLLVVNAAVVMVASDIVSGVQVDGIGSALAVSLVITAVSLLLNTLLAIDDEASWSRYVVRRAARRRGLDPSIATLPSGAQPPAGVIMLEIDGCSHTVLQRAMRAGWVPNMHELVRNGSHTLCGWETSMSSQTGASQAGLLLGSDEGIVAFRWYDRSEKRVVVSSAPRDAMALEDKLSSGAGLLVGGASRNNMFAGDAAQSVMTLSQVLRPGGADRAYSAFFTQPYNMVRTIVLAVRDICQELVGNARMRRRRVWPRLDHKGWKYPIVRVGTTVVLRDVTCQILVGDMMRGVPSAYATFVGYDEVAHHDGVERPQALDQLRQLDLAFARVMRAAQQAPRSYEFVVLSDHGQSHGATFLQRYGITLEQLVRRHLADDISTQAWMTANEPGAQFEGTTPKASWMLDDTVEQDAGDTASGDVLVMASGNLGLVYLADRTERATLEELETLHPDLVEGVASHPGVGFVFVTSSSDGPLVVGARGRHVLKTGRIEGEDPLAPFGPRTADKLLRHDTFENLPDLLVISMYDPATDEVAAFEELIGSHGGVGGEQEHPFILYPTAWPEPDPDLLFGAHNVHRQLVAWLEECGARTASDMPTTRSGDAAQA